MPQENEPAGLTRAHARTLVFVVIAAVIAYLCWQVVEPLVAPITCALALAVVARPAHAWLLRRVRHQSLAAALALLLVAVTLVIPAVLAGRQVAQEAVAAAARIQAAVKDGRWHEYLERNPRLSAGVEWLDASVNLRAQLGKLADHAPQAVQAIMSGSVQFAFGAGIALFLLFFFLRDRVAMLEAIRALLPLSAGEASQVFRKLDDTVYAILYGTLAVCLVQGALGALAFWWLGLHAPLLWGSAMAVMAIIPVVGTAIVWGPAVLYLLMQGNPEKAILLAAWGFLVIGLIDNVLKPAIVKNRLHVHVVPVFVAILGGLAAFGATGAIIGPVILAVALALIDIAHRRAQAMPA